MIRQENSHNPSAGEYILLIRTHRQRYYQSGGISVADADSLQAKSTVRPSDL